MRKISYGFSDAFNSFVSTNVVQGSIINVGQMVEESVFGIFSKDRDPLKIEEKVNICGVHEMRR